MTGEHGIWGLDYQLHPSRGGKAKLTPGRQRPINYVKAPDVTCLTFYFANKRWGWGIKEGAAQTVSSQIAKKPG